MVPGGLEGGQLLEALLGLADEGLPIDVHEASHSRIGGRQRARCSLRAMRSEHRADLVRGALAGVHTGEVAIVGGQARGMAVHAAARVAALAGPGEVLASATTHDMLDGSGLSFESRGPHELKGLSGSRAIFALVR